MRECKLATKAGFFYSLQKVSTPIKRRPVFTERFGNVSLAQATVLAAVLVGRLFIPPTRTQPKVLPWTLQIKQPAHLRGKNLLLCSILMTG